MRGFAASLSQTPASQSLEWLSLGASCAWALKPVVLGRFCLQSLSEWRSRALSPLQCTGPLKPLPITPGTTLELEVCGFRASGKQEVPLGT